MLSTAILSSTHFNLSMAFLAPFCRGLDLTSLVGIIYILFVGIEKCGVRTLVGERRHDRNDHIIITLDNGPNPIDVISSSTRHGTISARCKRELAGVLQKGFNTLGSSSDQKCTPPKYLTTACRAEPLWRGQFAVRAFTATRTRLSAHGIHTRLEATLEEHSLSTSLNTLLKGSWRIILQSYYNVPARRFTMTPHGALTDVDPNKQTFTWPFFVLFCFFVICNS